jgi:hypothetical protein
MYCKDKDRYKNSPAMAHLFTRTQTRNPASTDSTGARKEPKRLIGLRPATPKHDSKD